MNVTARGPADISITARYTAAAWESLGLPHAERFADPLGRLLVRASRLAARFRGFSMADDILTPRHLYMDDWLRQRRPQQVVEVAAGFSPRGLMFAGEGVRYVEVDRPPVIAEKKARSGAAGAALRFVAADALQADFAQRVLDHCEKGLSTVMVNEGLSPYFSRESYLSLLRQQRAVAHPLSAVLLTDFYLAPPRASAMQAGFRLSQIGMKLFADRFHLYCRDEADIRSLFAEAGWQVEAIARPGKDPRYLRGREPRRRDLVRIVEARPRA